MTPNGGIADAPIIIGGGPAGSAAAITLARAGYRPILIERTIGPTDKVCGDFLSADTIQRARSLGVDPAALGASPISRVRLIHGDRIAEATLPFDAMGLSRRVLDAALLRAAEQEGADVRRGQNVRHLKRETNDWLVQADETLTTRTVFLATGKHDLRDLPRPHTARDAIGMKMYFALPRESARRLDGAVELTLFPGGYAGMQNVEDERTVLCVAVQRHAFQTPGGSWAALVASIGQHSRRFAAMVSGATPLLPRPLAVAGIPYGYRPESPPPDGLFRLGDQVAVIPSLTGDGIAIALHSGAIGAESWLAGETAASYQKDLGFTLNRQMRLAHILHRACLNGWLQSAIVRSAALFPCSIARAGTLTRLPDAARITSP